jgi:hypothetical protein
MREVGSLLLATVVAGVVWVGALKGVQAVGRHVPPLGQMIAFVQVLYSARPSSPQPAAEHNEHISTNDPNPVLPTRLVAVVGTTMPLYFDSFILSERPDDYSVEVHVDGIEGKAERRRWSFTPEQSQIGSHRLTVEVKTLDGVLLNIATATLDVVAPRPPPDPLNILLVGDSITQQNIYPNALWNELDKWTEGRLRFVGTNQPLPSLHRTVRQALPKVFHEGYGGWGFQLFASHYLPGQEAFYKRGQSPFVFVENGGPRLDVSRYLGEQKIQGGLDCVILEAGLNETFGLDPDNTAALDQGIDEMLGWADKLVSAFHQASPTSKIGIVLPAPFTRSAPTFEHVYGQISKVYADPWRHRRIQHRIVQRMIQHWALAPGVFLIPTYLEFDTIDGYWNWDAGHPNEFGGGLYAMSVFGAMADAVGQK